MYVPVSSVHIAGEEEPAYCGNYENRNNYAPNGYRTNLTGDAWTTKVWKGCEPENSDGSCAGHNRAKLSIKEYGTITYSRCSNSNIRNNKRYAVSIAAKEVTALAERIFCITTHATRVLAVHTALSECISQEHGTYCCYQPGNDGKTTYLSEFSREHNNAGTHHVNSCNNNQLCNTHLFTFTHVNTPLTTPVSSCDQIYT